MEVVHQSPPTLMAPKSEKCSFSNYSIPPLQVCSLLLSSCHFIFSCFFIAIIAFNIFLFHTPLPFFRLFHFPLSWKSHRKSQCLEKYMKRSPSWRSWAKAFISTSSVFANTSRAALTRVTCFLRLSHPCLLFPPSHYKFFTFLFHLSHNKFMFL